MLLLGVLSNILNLTKVSPYLQYVVKGAIIIFAVASDTFRRVKAKGIATSLDLAAVDPDTDAGRNDWEAFLTAVLPETDFFVQRFLMWWKKETG